MNENAKKDRFNSIDALIILLVIVMLVSVVYRAVVNDGNTIDMGLKEYRVYFTVDDIRSTSLKYFVAGDTVRIKSTNAKMGTLDGIVQHVPAVGAYNDNGAEVFYPELKDQTIYDDTRYSVIGYITVKGEMTSNGFLLSGTTSLTSNSVLRIVTDHIETDIRIISINEK